jgi:hypothetical protein
LGTEGVGANPTTPTKKYKAVQARVTSNRIDGVLNKPLSSILAQLTAFFYLFTCFDEAVAQLVEQ